MWKVLYLFCICTLAAASAVPSGCGGDRDLIDDEDVILSHPSIGLNKYPSNLNCTWIIVGRRGKVVRLRFHNFSLEGSSGCRFDSLTVYDGPRDTSRLVKSLCGSTLPADIYSSNQSLMLRFKSDGKVERNGFRIYYKLVDQNAPTITTSPPTGEIQVGTTLRCEAVASPPPRVTLWMRLKIKGQWREVDSNISSAKYKLPMETRAGSWIVECVADNSVGEKRTRLHIIVKKLLLPMVLDMGNPLINAKERRSVTCRTRRPDSDLDRLELSFSTDVQISRIKDAAEMTIKTRTTNWKTITTFPHVTAGVTILRPPTSGQAIEGILTVAPRHNGCIVTCEGESVPNKGKEGKQITRIQVRWPPSVRSLRVDGKGGFGSPVTPNEPAFIRCELQKGDSSREKTAFVTATLGGKDLGKSHLINNIGPDRDGYKWEEQIWSHTFRPQDRGIIVTCGFVGEEPRRTMVAIGIQDQRPALHFSPPHEIFAGEFVNCSAKGNPSPVVKLEGFGNTARGITAASLPVPARAKGSYNVKCTVINKLGTDSNTATVIVHKKRIPVTFLVSQSGQEINSTITLKCEPRSPNIRVSSVNLTFASGQEVYWTKKDVQNIPHRETDKKRKATTIIVRASPFMRGTVQCRLETADHTSVGMEEKWIELKWKPKPRRLFTSFETKRKGGGVKEGDLLNLTCEVEVGSPPTKEQVEFSGREINGQMTIGKDLHINGWTLRNVSTQVRLTWRHDDEIFGCSFGGEKITKHLKVEHAPTILVIGPSLVVTPGQAVGCTAVGRPLPSVSMRLEDQRPGWEEKTGFGRAELIAGDQVEERSYTIVCEARNRHGEDRQTAVVKVEAKEANYYGSFVTAAVFCVIFLMAVIILVFLLFNIRRWRVSTENISDVNRLQAFSNTYSDETRNNYVAMQTSQQGQAELRQTNSRIVCSGVYEEILYSPSQSVQNFRRDPSRPVRHWTRTRPDSKILERKDGSGPEPSGVNVY